MSAIEDIEREKQRAAEAAAELVQDGMTVGLGTGSTAAYLLPPLANLGDGHARTTSQLGTAVGAKPTTLTGVLDRLEGRGYITRAASPADRRATVITTTAAGKRVARRIRKAMTDLERDAVAGLPPESIEVFRTVLDALTEEIP